MAAGGSVDHAEQRPDRHLDAMLEPGIELFEAPIVHPDLAAPVALPVTDQYSSSSLVDVGLGQGERFGDAQPAAPQHSDQRPDPESMVSSPAWRMTRMISSARGGSGAYCRPLLGGHAPPGTRRRGRRATTPGDVEQRQVGHVLLLSEATNSPDHPDHPGSSRRATRQSSRRNARRGALSAAPNPRKQPPAQSADRAALQSISSAERRWPVPASRLPAQQIVGLAVRAALLTAPSGTLIARGEVLSESERRSQGFDWERSPRNAERRK